jgi:YfiH family protein
MEFELQSAPGAVPYLSLPGFGGSRGGRVRLVFTTRRGGASAGPYAELNLGMSTGDDSGRVAENRRLLCSTLSLDVERLSIVKQVHSDRVVVVDKPPTGDEPTIEADAQVTGVPGLPLFGLFADCLAVMIYDPVHGAIGLAHAGWRGTVAGIAGKMVAVMAERYGTRPEQCHAALAPAAGPCCYEVGDEVADAARAVFPPEWKVLRPKGRSEPVRRGDPEVRDGRGDPEGRGDPKGRSDMESDGPFSARGSGGKWTFDLWSGNAGWLRKAGLRQENIVISRFCTICRQDLFFSYRGSGGRTGRMAALITRDA